MSWDSEQYLKFKKERQQPCLDLLSRLDGDYKHILDLGCGPGNSTVNLEVYFPKAEIIGFDSDENMLKRAKAEHQNFCFIHGFAPQDFSKLNNKFDLVFSNACIHWIPDQSGLIASINAILKDSGTFAVQIPIAAESKFYKLLYGLIENKWSKLKSVSKFHMLDQDGYYNELIKHFSEVTIWRTDYYHLIDSKNMVIEWYKGSGLRPYLSALDEKEQKEFIADLSEIIEKEYHPLDDGQLFLIMPRLFFIAKK